MKITSIYIVVALIILQSCSTSKRVHERPNFTLQGEAQKKEIENFKLENVWKYGGRFQDEGAFTTAKRKDLEPLMEEVSPKSLEMYKKNDFKENMIWVVAAAWFGTIFLESDRLSPFYWVGAGTFLGYSIYINEQRSDVVDQYNKDLEKKFSPSLTYTFEY